MKSTAIKFTGSLGGFLKMRFTRCPPAWTEMVREGTKRIQASYSQTLGSRKQAEKLTAAHTNWLSWTRNNDTAGETKSSES